MSRLSLGKHSWYIIDFVGGASASALLIALRKVQRQTN